MVRQIRLSINELRSVVQIRARIGGAGDCDEGCLRSLTVGIMDRLTALARMHDQSKARLLHV